MKKSYRKNIWRTIRQSLSRFGAIFAIVALGVGFLAGLLATTPDMRDTADGYFDRTNLFDVRVVSTLGLTEEDVTALRAVDGVADAMPAYATDMMVQRSADSATLVTRMHSLPDSMSGGDAGTAGYLNQLELLEGRLPARAGECVVLSGQPFGDNSTEIGDTLTVTDDNKDPDDTFALRRFTVVGKVASSYYFSDEREPASVGNGSLALVLFTPAASFAADLPYTNIFLTVRGAAETNSLTDAYTDTIDAAIDRIEAISGARCDARLAQVKGDANAELNDAKTEYEDAKAEVAQELADAEKELADGRKKLIDGEQKLADAKKELADGEKKLTDGKAEYAKQSTEGAQKLADAEAELVKARTALADGHKQYEDGKKLFDDGKKQYEDGKKQYDAGVKQLAAGEAFVAQYQPLIEAAEAALAAIPDVGAAEQAFKASLDAALASYQGAYAALANGSQSNPALSTDPATLQAQLGYFGAQLALDGAMLQVGHTSEAAWLAADPAAANAAIAPRDAAKSALAAGGALDPDGTKLLAEAVEGVMAVTRNPFVTAAEQYVQLKQAQALAAYRPQLDKAVAEIAANKPVLEATRVQLEAAKQKIDASQAELTAAKQKLDDGEAALRTGEAQLAEGRKALETGLAEAAVQLTDAEKKLADGRAEYTKGLNELDDARKKLADGEQEYIDGKAEADKELSDAAEKLRDAEREIAKIEQPEWYVLDRMSNVSYNSFAANVEKVESIAGVFPVFFFLVAALVALTTMTRMVEEERLQIGTMKALGYKKGAIMAKYVFYAMSATAAGSVFGLLVGFKLFPTVIWNAYSMMYVLPDIVCQFNWKYAIIGSGAAIFSTLAATLNACWGPLHEAPAQLMRPRAPKAGKRIFLEHLTPLWKRMKFTYKVTARNLFLYKKRFFMTVIGIAGCTGLLVTGFGLHDSISDIVTKQFGEIFTYDLLISVKKESGLQDENITSLLDDPAIVDHYLAVHQEKSSNTFGDETFTTYLFVPQDGDRLSEVVTLRDRQTHAPVAFEPDKGVVITEKMAERTGYGVGDTIELKNNDDIRGEFLITGVAENYVENYVYLSEELYKEQFGYAPEFITYAARMVDTGKEKENQAMRDAISEKLLDVDTIASVSYTADIMTSFSNMLTKIDTIVVVLIISAGLLAFVVLYNLTNINITEREKEIATIKVLGFFDREVSGYVYRESAMLTLIGGLVGLVIGVAFHRFVIYTVEVDQVMFGRTISAMSYLYSFGLTILFSLIVNMVMQRKLRRVDMVSSMKAPE